MKVGIYARVSTTDKGQDVGMQLHELEAHAKGKGVDRPGSVSG